MCCYVNATIITLSLVGSILSKYTFANEKNSDVSLWKFKHLVNCYSIFTWYGVYKALTGVANKCSPAPYSLPLVGWLYRLFYVYVTPITYKEMP